jgi:hypothetical protein
MVDLIHTIGVCGKTEAAERGESCVYPPAQRGTGARRNAFAAYSPPNPPPMITTWWNCAFCIIHSHRYEVMKYEGEGTAWSLRRL